MLYRLYSRLLFVILLLIPTAPVVQAAPARDPFGNFDLCNNRDAFGNLEAPLPDLEGQTVVDVACNNKPILFYVNFIYKFITAAIILLGLIMIVIGGYLYMTAGGDGKQVEKAKSVVGGALLGIILALTAFVILNTIGDQFAENLQEPTFPVSP